MEMLITSSELGNCSLLPEELIIYILTRLPVKSLIRFKCVSKKWMDLTRSPCFISKHVTRMKNANYKSSSHNYSCGGVVATTQEDWSGWHEYDIPESPYGFVKLNLGPYLHYKPSYGGDNGGNRTTVPYSIIGYCNGIFCLSWNHLERYNTMYDGYQKLGEHIVIALCNPAIRELRILPLSGTDFPPYQKQCCVEIGFGFDPKTNDYKVVKIVTLPDEESEAVDFIEVYSMKSDSWRMIVSRGSDDYAVAQNLEACAYGGGICTSTGILHWTMGSWECDMIASFNMDDNALRMTKFPSKYASFDRYKKHYLSLLYDKLALICNYDTGEEFNCVEIFLLNNYDDDDDDDSSWSLLTIMESFPQQFSTMGFWLESFLFVFDWQNDNPLLYDMVTKQFMDLHQITIQRAFFYRESLVSVKRGGCEEEDCYNAISPSDFHFCLSQYMVS